MQIEHITGISFTSGRTLQQKGDGSVCNGMFAQIIIDDQGILSFVHKVFCQRCTCVWCDVLKRRGVAGHGSQDDGIFHGTMFFQVVDNSCNGRSFLTDCNVHTNNAFAFLVDNCIFCNRSFTCLTVTDDQFTLTTADWEHGVNGKDTCFQWCINRLTINDRRCRFLDGTIFSGSNITFAVDRFTQGVDNSSFKGITDGNAGSLACTDDLAAFTNGFVVAKKDTTDFISTDILYHTFDAAIEDNDFAVHRMVDTVNCGNTIADPDDFTGLFGFIVPVVIFYFIFYNRYNIVCTNDTHIITSFRVLNLSNGILQLTDACCKCPIVFFVADTDAHTAQERRIYADLINQFFAGILP